MAWNPMRQAHDPDPVSAPTMAEFLLARIAEDEVIAQDFVPEEIENPSIDRQRWIAPLNRWIILYDPRRVVAECEAKRRIVELHMPTVSSPLGVVDAEGDLVPVSEFERIVRTREVCMACASYPDAPCATLRLLALPYAAHPDYRDEWRPDAVG